MNRSTRHVILLALACAAALAFIAMATPLYPIFHAGHFPTKAMLLSALAQGIGELIKAGLIIASFYKVKLWIFGSSETPKQ